MIQEWNLKEATIKALESLDYFHFFIICRNYFPDSVLLSSFKILMPNLDRRRFDF